MMKHVVFFLEEPSAQDFLQGVLPGLLPDGVTAHFLVFEGKQDLEKQLPLRLRGWQRLNSRFIVLRDQDSGDCRVIKHNLQTQCVEAGQPDAVVRIACRELEAFFVGDWLAVAQAFDKPALARLDRAAKYRDPDKLGSPSHEIRRVLPAYQKRDGARRISAHMAPARNRSRSFQVLFETLRRLKSV